MTGPLLEALFCGLSFVQFVLASQKSMNTTS